MSEATECPTPYGSRGEAYNFDSMEKAPNADHIDRIMYL